jgi:hypothetical protein
MASIPVFDFETPQGYRWLIERGLIGFVPFSSLQPWHYLRAEEVFDLSARWPDSSRKARLVAFARRQDCDDLACFEVVSETVTHIVLVHGWTPGGYEIVATFESFWEWLKSVMDDVADWVERSIE